MTDERLVAVIRAEIQMLSNERSPWVDMCGLAEYRGWGFNTVKRLSSRNQIAGKVRHDGKVRFQRPTFDDWLLTSIEICPLTESEMAVPKTVCSIESCEKPRKRNRVQ